MKDNLSYLIHQNKRVILIYKPVGKTPLEMITELKKINPLLVKEKISYAGRLDPMADGLLLLLVGDENKERAHYLKLPKTYYARVVFGIATDSYDCLGLIQQTSNKSPSLEKIQSVLKTLIGEIQQAPPLFSSYRVQGKPLFYYARKGSTKNIDIPKIKRTVFDAKLIDYKLITKHELKKIIFKNLSLVKGDFRQDEIIKKWQDFFDTTKQEKFVMSQIEFNVSSGTYIRALANHIGVMSGNSAFALTLTRTKIGGYSGLKEVYLSEEK